MSELYTCSNCVDSLQHEREHGYSLAQYPEVWEHLYQLECQCCGPSEVFDTVRTNVERHGVLNLVFSPNVVRKVLNCVDFSQACDVCEHNLPEYKIYLPNDTAQGVTI